MVCSLRARVDKENQGLQKEERSRLLPTSTGGFFFFFGLHKRNRNFRSSLVDLSQKVLDPSGPMALQTGEINTIGAKQVVGMEGPEQKQVQLFFGETLVKLPTQMSGSCQEKGSCRRGLTV